MLRRSFLACLACLSACAPSAEDPRGFEAATPLARAIDRSAEPHVVEIELVAAPARWEIEPGHAVDGLAYNGSVPGPLIEAEVGDELVVHFRNELEEPTTIHWHGVRVPADMDGGPHSQPPVPPGGTFEYRFVLPDAGTFWYHPHALEAAQMERGLYGAIVVRGPDEPEVDVESVLVLDDLTLDASGAIAPFGGLLETHSGREGLVQLVNGTVTPTAVVRAGQRHRWRIVNAGSARFYRLALDGHAWTVIGSDGGRLPAPVSEPEIFLVPGDRLDVIVDVAPDAAPGSTLALSNLRYPRGHGAGLYVPMAVAALEVSGDPALPAREPVLGGPPIEAIDPAGATMRELRFSETLDAATETVTFAINGESWPDVTPLGSRVGTTEVWDLVNESEMDHPFHLHGFFFQVLSRDGLLETSPRWEDTIDLVGETTTRVAFRIDDRPGMWMFHCHILEHTDHGMMGTLDVAP